MYRPSRPEFLGSFTPAQRARTVLAAAGPLPWQVQDVAVLAPFFEVDGSPVLVSAPEHTATLLASGRVTVRLELLPAIGTVVLTGRAEPAGPEYGPAAARYRSDHARCDARCGARAGDLVRIELDSVQITPPGGEELHPVDLADYHQSTPHHLLVECLTLAEHLNQEHLSELITMASGLIERPDSDLIAVAVDWIDPDGIDLSVIDDEGSTTLHADFRHPLTATRGLGVHLHHLLSDPHSRLRIRTDHEAQ